MLGALCELILSPLYFLSDECVGGYNYLLIDEFEGSTVYIDLMLIE